MYLTPNPFLLHKNIEGTLTNFYTDNLFDRDFLTDLIEVWRSAIDFMGTSCANIAQNVDPFSVELSRVMSFFKIVLSDSIYSPQGIQNFESLKMKDRIEKLKKLGHYEQLSVSRLWDKTLPQITWLEVNLTIDPETLKFSNKLVYLSDYVLYDNNLFFFSSGVQKIKSLCQTENGGHVAYLTNITCNYNKIEKMYGTCYDLKNDYNFSNHAFRSLVASLLTLSSRGMKLDLIQDMLSSALDWPSLEAIDFYSADENQKKYWQTNERTRFDFLVRALATKESGRDREKLQAIAKVFSSIRLAHIYFDTVIYAEDKVSIQKRETLHISSRIPQVSDSLDKCDDFQVMFTPSSIEDAYIIELFAKQESFELLKSAVTIEPHEQISANAKGEFIFDDGFVFDDNLYYYMDKPEVVVGFGDSVEVIYSEP